MKITIESTDNILEIDGVAVRLWNGRTEGGIECHVFIHRLAVAVESDSTEFDRALAETTPPARMVGT